MSMNQMEIDGQTAIISFDPEAGTFRGEFIHLNGGADFYADNIDELKQEGHLSLKAFLETCAENGIEPFRKFSGKFNVRVSPELHSRLTAEARARNVSLNQLVIEAVSKECA